jgi:uncharacterized membrane protein
MAPGTEDLHSNEARGPRGSHVKTLLMWFVLGNAFLAITVMALGEYFLRYHLTQPRLSLIGIDILILLLNAVTLYLLYKHRDAAAHVIQPRSVVICIGSYLLACLFSVLLLGVFTPFQALALLADMVITNCFNSHSPTPVLWIEQSD